MHPSPLCLLTPLALLLILSGCNSQADTTAQAPQPRPVLAAKVEAASTQQNAYTGVVAARTESDLGFRVSGKVIERKVDPGQHVSRGDTLLVLDIGDFELALRSAKNRVNAAQAQLRQRRDDENRYQRLASTGAVSRQIFDQSATNLRVAEAELAAAQSDASQIENRRTYSVLKADGDGIITDVRVDRGQVVAEGQVVARLAHDGAEDFMVRLRELAAVDVLKAYRQQGERLRDEELIKAQRMLANGSGAEEVLMQLARGLTNKLLHAPSVQLKKLTEIGRASCRERV